jgi:hypothetical protein
MLEYGAWRIPSAAYLAVGRVLLAAKFAELRQCEIRRIHLPRTPVNKFLRGMTTLRKLAQALEVDPAEPVRGE